MAPDLHATLQSRYSARYARGEIDDAAYQRMVAQRDDGGRDVDALCRSETVELVKEDRLMSIISRILPQNEGTADRLVRVALGIALLALVFIGPKSAWGLVGLFPLATGLLGSCPAYTPFGVSTRRPHTTAHS